MSILDPGDVLQGRYRIDRLLGEGGMSWVYRGHHLLLEQAVAIKVIKPLYTDPEEARQHAEQLRVEAAIMARLDHPNLVRAFDMFAQGDEWVLVLEMVEGRNLEQVAELAPKPISERRVLAWTAQVLDALEYLHAQQPPVIVRDLKPGNIMLARDGRIRLIDFGLAKRMDSQGSGTRAIVRGMGSEGYAPLEQYAHTSTDARSDLYAVGATMYFLLTKKVPPSAAVRVSDAKPMLDPRSINPSVSAPVWAGIQALLALRADDRPPNAAAARQVLGLPARAPSAVEAPEVAPAGLSSSAPAKGKRCAGCDLLLRPYSRDGVEIDVCPDCGGIWLDRGELERLVDLGRDVEPPPFRYDSGGDSDVLEDRSRREPSRFSQASESQRSAGGSQASSRASDRGRRREPDEGFTRGLYKVWKLLARVLD